MAQLQSAMQVGKLGRFILVTSRCSCVLGRGEAVAWHAGTHAITDVHMIMQEGEAQRIRAAALEVSRGAWGCRT